MRFSLSTLLIIVFWLAAILLAWLWREPWVFDKKIQEVPRFVNPIAPDGLRTVTWGTFELSILEGVDYSDNKPVLWSFAPNRRFKGRWIVPRGFVDDDAVVCDSFIAGSPSRENVEFLQFRRRFPEWWWGHFYRPEVWLAITLSAVLLVRASRAIRARFRPVGTT
jgi:hypothetical protein